MSLNIEDGLNERGHWVGRLDFIFSLIGLSVGLGNVWRFPYLCYKNGGGAFLIPYLICLAVGGIPVLLLELGLGQFTSQGGITCWNILHGWQGIGIAGIIVLSWLNCYYNVILAWAIYYIGLSFAKPLPWSHCNNEFNTEKCLEPEWIYGNANSTSLETCDVNQTGKELKQVCLNGTLTNLSDFTPAVEEFWERKILQVHLSSGIDDVGTINWQLMISLIVAWIIVFLIICKGVKSSGKVVYFTATFPYVIITIILIRAVTLENAFEGIRFYMRPDISRLLDGQVWLDAATQIFFSYSIGHGAMLSLSSYNKNKNNCIRDGLLFACVNSGTSLYSGFVIFAILGFMAGQQNVGVGEVAKGGPGLAFIAYPEAVAQMPLPQLWAVLFFITILLLGIDSQFCQCEGFITAIADTWPRVFRKGHRREIFVAIYCFVSCCIGMSMITHGGIYLMQLFDYYSASGTALLWIAFFEVMAITYFYGGNRFIGNLKLMLTIDTNYPKIWRILEKYLQICWFVLTPVSIAVMFIFSLITHERLTYQGYVYPWWGYGIGWFMALSSMVMIPLFFVISFLSKKFRER
ncbi:sodium- and chloride-dependent taurine transporter-like [Amphiura filiformis]|uniref:sodium- and chloride-dependent taurine transporter-like n=1 Tax=Amphiura filiformis TaxID=82378 RepID=UPI003B2154ED